MSRWAQAAGVLASLLLVAGPRAGRAQPACDDALRQAQKTFDLGLFEDIPGQLAPCLGARLSRATAVQVHSLLARSYLAMDDLKKARQEVSTILRFDATFEAGPPPRFAELVAQVRREKQTVQVASVSKSTESLREAPATVAVLTAEEIARRGYNDLEEMLHDLPGFDISRSRGRTYSNIYQRGFRSTTTDRTLFLVDGVEQNDIWSNIAYISRQYPVSTIDRVEVVYGPASTMYGANAFTGVINVITKGPSEFYRKDRELGAEAQVTSGSWNTQTAEFGLGGRNGSESVRWSLTGRAFRSDEPPISQFAGWRFNGDDVKNVDYGRILGLSGKTGSGQYLAQAVLDGLASADMPFIPPEVSPFYVIHRDANGVATSVTLTPAGVAEAQRLDRIGLATPINGRPPGALRSTQDFFLTGKLELPNFVLGVQVSHLDEGSIGESTDLAQAGNLTNSAPRSFAVYAKYSRDLGSTISLSFLGQYRKDDFADNNAITSYGGFVTGQVPIFALALGNKVFAGAKPFTRPWLTIFSYEASTQLHGDLTLLYQPSPDLALVSGVEVRDGSLQISPSTNTAPSAAEQGGPGGVLGGSDQLDQLDLSAYSQLSWRLRKDLKLVAGGRFDYDRVRSTLGYGTAFNPRLALVYLLHDLTFKAVYAEGFKVPSNAEKYGTIPRVNEIPNIDLKNERVKDFELSAGWEAQERLKVALSAYQSTYSNIVALQRALNTNCDSCGFTGQFQNIGRLQVRGIEADLKYRGARLDAFLNYTFTHPYDTNPRAAGLEGGSQVRVGDIASHHLNGGVDLKLFRDLNADLRANFVGSRRTGIGTTVPANPFSEIGSYATASITLTYTRILLPASRGSRLQLGIDNLFDRLYYDPGISEASGIFTARLPQAGRSVFVRLATAY